MKPFKKTIRILIFLPILVTAGCNQSDNEKETVPSITPESLGISSQSILSFIDAVEKERKDELHSFMLLRYGEIAAKGWWAPYNPESPHMLYSLSKSFASTAIGIAQEEGLLSIDDPVISFFPDETPENPSNNLKAMRIRDLLKMNTGHNEDATGRMQKEGESWVKGFLNLPVEHKPGTHFVYNSAATFMLSAIIQKVTAGTLLQYLTPRLFKPLGITNPTWESNMNGINMGGWGLKIRTQDIANFGQLYLQEGQWNGEQLIPAKWVREATSFQTSNGSNPESDWEQGYGYQFWRCRHNLYRGDGAFGQYCIVMPEQDAVVAITSGTNDMQAILNLVWDHLFPAMKSEPLEENETAYSALRDKMETLSLSVIEGDMTSALAASLSGTSFIMEPNNEGFKNLSFNLMGDGKTITFTRGDGNYTVPVGSGTMKNGTFPVLQFGGQAISTTGAWISEDTFQMRTYLYETPYYFDTHFTFDRDKVSVDRTMNVSFGQGGLPPLKGIRKTD